MDVILIPVKRLAEAKSRLAAPLSPADRRRLGLTMLADVLRATEKWTNRLIVTSDPDAEAVGLAFGCALVPDAGRGLNDAVAAGTARAVASGATALLVLPADVPLVASDDVTGLFAADADVAVAASDDGGTNALLRRPPDVLGTRFGPRSAAVHEALAREAGLRVRTLDLPSLRLDVDDLADLERLAASEDLRESVRVAQGFRFGYL